MISVENAVLIHEVLIDKFGGTKGIRDLNLLESAIFRSFQTFDSNDLYPTPTEKAAALIESILVNHPFSDGNKRTGYVLMRLLLMQDGLDVFASEDEKYGFVIGIAKGQLAYNEIVNWLNDKVK